MNRHEEERFALEDVLSMVRNLVINDNVLVNYTIDYESALGYIFKGNISIDKNGVVYYYTFDDINGFKRAYFQCREALQ